MDASAKAYHVVDSKLHHVPEIGLWLWALQDTRRALIEALEGVTDPMVDWVPPDGGSSIGTVLYHIADIEADWLYVEVLEQPIPPAVAALFPFPTRDANGRLTQAPGFSLEQHLSRLSTVRNLVLDAYLRMDLAAFRLVHSFEQYDVTPEWVLHHLVQHEAEHRGQIGTIRDAARYFLALGHA